MHRDPPPPLSPREIHARLGRLVEPKLWSPAWIVHGWLQRLLCGGLKYRETIGDPSVWAEFLSLHPGPTQDTFMATPAGACGKPLMEAAARARALAEVLHDHRDRFHGQPLLVGVYDRGGTSVRRSLPTGLGPPEIGILHGDRYVQVRAAGRPVVDLAREIGRRLREVIPGSPGRVSVPAVVEVTSVPLERAWHLHRRMGLEGPWLGCSRVSAPALDLLSTRHLVVDGFGHTRIFNAWRASVKALETPDADLPELPPLGHSADPRVPPVGFLPMELDANGLGFSALAYAFGLALQTAQGARQGPTFQVPCIPDRDPEPASDWRSSRITAVLAAVRSNAQGHPEPLERFEARLKADLAAEDGLTGLASDGMRKLGRVPLPPALKAFLQTIVDQAAASVPGPPAYLMGSGLFSYIKMARDEDSGEPRWAASWPPPYRTMNLGPGGIACTVIEQGGRRSVGIAGSGASGRSLGRFANRFLEVQEEMLERRRASPGRVESRHDR